MLTSYTNSEIYQKFKFLLDIAEFKSAIEKKKTQLRGAILDDLPTQHIVDDLDKLQGEYFAFLDRNNK